MNYQCVEQIFFGRQFLQCKRNGTVEREGKRYCKQHDPVEIERKDQARRERHAKEWKLQKEHDRRKRAMQRLCADITTEALELMTPLSEEK